MASVSVPLLSERNSVRKSLSAPSPSGQRCQVILHLAEGPVFDLQLKPSEPPLQPAERAIVKNYGGWGEFMMCFGLKPWETEDEKEGMAILRAFVQGDKEDAEEAAKATAASGVGGKGK